MGEGITKKFVEYQRAIFIIALFVIYGAIAHVFTGTSCFFRSTAGIPCSGCGLTRAYLSLLKGDLAKAFFYHPLFWYIPFIAAAMFFTYRKYKTLNTRKFMLFIKLSFILFLLVYIVRMLLYFPHTEPMTINDRALLPGLIKPLISLIKQLVSR